MNAFRLFPKYQYPVVVSASRPCRVAGSLVREGTRLSVGQRPLAGTFSSYAREQGSPLDRWQGSESCALRKIVLADDHPVVRQSLKRLLNQQADFQLVGESDNGLETLSLVKRLQPDLLVTDLMMPGLNGLEVTRRIRLSFPGTRVVVISVNADEPYVAGAFRCGASAFVLKTACGRHLLPALRAVLAGERYISPPFTEPPM